MGLVKVPYFLNKRRQYKRLRPRSLSRCEKKEVEKTSGIYWLLFDSNDWFVSKNDSLEQMVLSFLTLLACTHNLHITKKIVSQWLKLVRLNHLKKLLLKYFQLDKDCLIIRAVLKHPIINFRRSPKD
jgi:hypothetical protein